jgi:hypothetical protein
MDHAAIAEPPLAAQAAEASPAGQAAPLDGALAAVPLGDEGIAWHGESPTISELLPERSAGRRSPRSGRRGDGRQIGSASRGLPGQAPFRDRFSQATY